MKRNARQRRNDKRHQEHAACMLEARLLGLPLYEMRLTKERTTQNINQLKKWIAMMRGVPGWYVEPRSQP